MTKQWTVQNSGTSEKRTEAAVIEKDPTVRHDGIIRVLPGERYTPLTLARKLGAKVILESSSFKKGRARYSIILVREAFTLFQRGNRIFLRSAEKSYEVKAGTRDFLDILLYFGKQHPPLHQDLPLPAGGVGFLGYEFAARCDTIRFQVKKDDLDLPDAAFLFGHVFVIFDHYTDVLYLIGMNYREHEIDLNAALDETEGKLDDLDFNYLSRDTARYAVRSLESDRERQLFLDGVSKVREEIVRGNLLQGVLSRRLDLETDMPAIDAYQHLRSANPSPYLFFLDFGDYQLFGSSPEMMVRVRDGMASVHAIAGTRRRGRDAAEDERLAAELLADEKERAEHLMLVDLARNDLGRFCKAGSVRVSEYMEVEYFSHVMHIVSRVEGALKDKATGIDAVRATFPAGTVSGAPKISAIEIIDRIEEPMRRFYAGLVGYVEPDGSLDTCITIRSALKRGNRMVLQAGAGIVYDSIPLRELEETGEKLRALAGAVGLEV